MSQESDLFEKLADWVDGRLTPAEIEALQTELEAADAQATADLAWLQQFRALSKEITLAQPPRELREHILTHLEPYIQKRQPPSFWQQIKATLAFDSSSQLVLAGVRSAAQLSERQLIYNTDFADIVLNIQPHPPQATIRLYGQIFPLDETEEQIFAVQLLSSQPEEVVTTAADELGEFRFVNITPGNYQLIISSDTVEIVIDSLVLTVT